MTKKIESISFRCIPVEQPIGTFYVGTIAHDDLLRIAYTDVRRIGNEMDEYLGIQRQLNERRVAEIRKYLTSPDACFPTAVILAVPGVCTFFDPDKLEMKLSSFRDKGDSSNEIPFDQIAKVIDGQHRIEGLRDYQGAPFQVNVSIFVEMDIADQAYLFSTVNLAQTKVNKSLVYDLLDYAKSRSPEKTCHNIAVALDQHERSPFHSKIKRLGVATEGRFSERITQATFVTSLMPYVSETPLEDRNMLKLGKTPPKLSRIEDLQRMIFRNMFLDKKDDLIIDVVRNYFDAVKRRWPEAWDFSGYGNILNRTNGFKALMRFLRFAYLDLTTPGKVPSTDQFLKIFGRIELREEDFNPTRYKPGSSGEADLLRDLMTSMQYHF